MLSIIMPVKNTARYLMACIDSIVQQTYTDWELIAVDDHSEDNSLEILNQYQSNDDRIVVLQNNGQGIIAALQTGYSKAHGDFITRMDSDDINELNKYEQMILQLVGKGAGHISLGQVNYFSESGVQDGFEKYQNWLNGLIENGNCFDEIYKECVIPSPCWMLHRSDFERIGAFSSAITPEDYDLCFRMYKNGLKPISTNQVLFNWRDYPERTSRNHADYSEQELLRIKCHYLIDIDFNSSKNLVLWGAGKRGKYVASYLKENKIPFSWACNNENKIGHDIYGIKLSADEDLETISDKQIIVTVSNPDEQSEIRQKCESEGWEFYLFC